MDKKIIKKKWTVKKLFLYGIILISGLLIILQMIFGGSESKLKVDVGRIQISTVARSDFQEFIPVIGNVIPVRTIYLDAVEGGRVEEKYLEAGSVVKKGDAILKLANTTLMLDIMYREAELFQQSNNLRNTRLAMEQNQLLLRSQILDLNYQILQVERDYNTNKELVAGNLISTQKFEESEDEYKYLVKKRLLALESHRQDSIFREVQLSQLENGLQRMEDNLEVVKLNLDNLTLKAPVSGHLTSLNAEIGESKVRGERLGQIDILDGFKVRANIEEYFVSKVFPGLAGSFQFNGETYQVKVDKVFPEILNGTFQVDFLFAGKEPQGIRRGQTQHIRLVLGDPVETLVLSRGGFFSKTGGQWVYVIDESGKKAYRKSIKLGRQNSDVYEVMSGLNPGEKIITSSYDYFGDADILILNK